MPTYLCCRMIKRGALLKAGRCRRLAGISRMTSHTLKNDELLGFEGYSFAGTEYAETIRLVFLSRGILFS